MELQRRISYFNLVSRFCTRQARPRGQAKELLNANTIIHNWARGFNNNTVSNRLFLVNNSRRKVKYLTLLYYFLPYSFVLRNGSNKQLA